MGETQTERWAKVAGFPDYSVSSKGRVRLDSDLGRFRAGHVLTAGVGKRGALYVNLRRGRAWKQRPLARLVMLAHAKPPGRDPSTLTIGFEDGDPSNCRIENLRWVPKHQAPKFQSPANAKPSARKRRFCLCGCGETFMSSGAGNRIRPEHAHRLNEHHDGAV